jgi:hypothetical protein
LHGVLRVNGHGADAERNLWRGSRWQCAFLLDRVVDYAVECDEWGFGGVGEGMCAVGVGERVLLYDFEGWKR